MCCWTYRRRFVPQIVTRDIMENILNRMPIPARTWKDYPMEMKDILFNDFKDKYQFATDYDQKMARTVWERTILDRYPNTLKKARETALKKANSMNLVDIKGHGPRGMKSEVWDGLVDMWLRPEWQRKSEVGRRNRASLPDHMLHTGGSISFGEHKRRMEVKLDRPVAFKEVYEHVHKKKDGEFVSEHSKNVMESYELAMTQKYGEDPSIFPEVDPDVWLEASGPNKKGRVLGIGHSLDIGIPDRRKDLSSDGASHSNYRPVIHAEVTEALNAALPEAISAALPAAISAVLPAAINATLSTFVQTQLLPILSMIPGYKPTNVSSPGRSTNGDNHDNCDEDNVD